MSDYDFQLNNMLDRTYRIIGDAVSPAAVRVKTLAPDGTSTTYTLGTDSEISTVDTNTYRVQIQLTQAGKYVIRFETDTPYLAHEDAVTVAKSAFYS